MRGFWGFDLQQKNPKENSRGSRADWSRSEGCESRYSQMSLLYRSRGTARAVGSHHLRASVPDPIPRNAGIRERASSCFVSKTWPTRIQRKPEPKTMSRRDITDAFECDERDPAA